MLLYTESDLRRAWIEHLISLYLLETNHEVDFGPYPNIDEFRITYEQELDQGI